MLKLRETNSYNPLVKPLAVHPINGDYIYFCINWAGIPAIYSLEIRSRYGFFELLRFDIIMSNLWKCFDELHWFPAQESFTTTTILFRTIQYDEKRDNF